MPGPAHCLQFYELQQKGEGGGSLLLTEQQQEWLRIQRMMARTSTVHKHMPPNQRLRAAAFDLVSTGYGSLIGVCACVHHTCMTGTVWLCTLPGRPSHSPIHPPLPVPTLGGSTAQ